MMTKQQKEEQEKARELQLAELEKEYKKELFTAGEDTLVYCFDEMSIDRVLQAQRMFRIDMEILKHLPKLPSEVQTIVERKTLQHAFAAMLMKKTHHGYEDYNPATVSSFDALKVLTGKDYKRLLECQQDFFLNSGLSSEVSIQQSEQQMKDAVNIMTAMSPEQLELIMPLIQSATNEQLQKLSEKSTITTESTGNKSESHSLGQ